jgi:beta-lactamase class A
MKSLGFLMILSTLASAQLLPEQTLAQKLLARVKTLDESFTGVLGVAAIDLTSGEVIQYNGNTVFPQASSIKIPILMQVYRSAREGKLRLDQPVSLEKKDIVGGSGHLKILLRSQPLTVTVRELATAMIETSDNTATNKLIAMVGMDTVNELLAELVFKETKLQRRMLDSKASVENRENISTPLEMARLAELLYRGKAIDGDASKEMIEMLKLVDANFRASIPDNVAVASKPGELNGVRAETGIVFLKNRPFVLSVMSTYLDPGVNPVPAVARMFYEHFEKLARSNRYGNKLQ